MLYYDEVLISVVDGYAYVDCFGGTYGKSATDVSRTFIGEDGKVDYRAVHDLLVKSDTESITYIELASLYALIKDNVLIGYCDGVAWFGEKADGETKVMRVTSDGIIHKSNVAWEIDEIYVINNSFVFYRNSKDAWITTLEDNTYQAIGIEKDADSWGKVLQIGYGVSENGDKTHTFFFTMTENKLFIIRATGTNTEGVVTKTFDREKDLGGLCVNVDGKNAIAWIENGNDYNMYTVYGE